MPDEQARLGYYGPSPAARLARRSDPATSRAGAQAAARTLNERQRAALAAVHRHPWRTASELEALEETLGRTIGRRLGELDALGEVVRGKARKCAVTGHPAAIWGPAE